MFLLIVVLFLFGVIAGPFIQAKMAPPLDIFSAPWAVAFGLIGSFGGALVGLSITGKSLEMDSSALIGAVVGVLIVAFGYWLLEGRFSGGSRGTGAHHGDSVAGSDYSGDSGGE